MPKRTNWRLIGKIGVLILITVSISGFIFKRHAPPKQALAMIEITEAQQHLYFLAADSLLGRNTPSPGLERAAQYIAAQFQKYGLAPVNGSYFQEIRLNRISLGDSNWVKITGMDGVVHDLPIKKEFIPFEMTADKLAHGQIVFAGYGITAPEFDYDDYANLDVTHKVVLIVKDAPRQFDSSSPFYYKKGLIFNKISEKVRNAIEHGAVAVLLVTNPVQSQLLRPSGYPWPSLYKTFPKDAIPFTLALTEKKKIPTVQVGEQAITILFGDVPALKKIVQEIDSTLTPKSFPVLNAEVEVRTGTRREVQTTQNVVGYWPGVDPKLQQEVIIIGAHYDHVGYQKHAAAGSDSIFNGADDNASGTTGVLLMARAFTASAEKPKRSVLFIAFTGEEKFLWGSDGYTELPLFPLNQTVAMLNLDMIGRLRGESVDLIGGTRSPVLLEMAKKENRQVHLKFNPESSQGFGGSDHVPFSRKKIPVLFFHSGLHDDYHQVSDHADKINYPGLCQISTLCFRLAWRLANSDTKPVYLPPKPKKRIRTPLFQ
ncbi:M28 family peptidase [candidate division KSB1 bacterium]|nr:M28 family peptidase [candidate division KSB1 bacterium]